MFFGTLVKEMSNLGNTCKEAYFFNFASKNAKIWQVLSRKANSGHFCCKSTSRQGHHFHKNWSSLRFHFETVGGTPLSEI